MSKSDQLWDAIDAVGSERRGFDGGRCWLPQFALPAGAAGPLLRELLDEDVRGTLAAIETLAGWWARTMPCDPNSATTRETVKGVVDELEVLTGSLRWALDSQTEQETS